jgi:hypothetical protein
LTSEQAAEIDACLATWRQGDVVRGDTFPFIHLADLRSPTTPKSDELARELAPDSGSLEIVGVDVPGLVVLTQTCDLGRPCTERPYVEVCPLIELPDDQAALVRLGRRPRFAPLPALNDDRLAADLDRVMTVEKGLIAALTDRRERGVVSDTEIRIFSEFLGMKRLRVALPDEFTIAVRRMRQRILDKHGAASREGQFLLAVREIRVRALPDWAAEEIEVEILFVFDHGGNIPDSAEHLIKLLTDRITIGGWIAAVDGRAVGLDQLSAASYLESDRLDLDDLSQRT